MSNFSVKNLLDGSTKAGSQIITQGWVRTRRDSKAGFSFIALYDGSCFHPIQVVAGKELTNYTEEVLHLTAGCSIQVEGELVASPGQGQDFEITAKTIKVLGFVENPDSYPISPKPHSVEYLREVAHLRPRTNVIGAMARVRNSAAQAIHRFFHEQNFYWISTPIITTNDLD